jgi:hypothetical protein
MIYTNTTQEQKAKSSSIHSSMNGNRSHQVRGSRCMYVSVTGIHFTRYRSLHVLMNVCCVPACTNLVRSPACRLHATVWTWSSRRSSLRSIPWCTRAWGHPTSTAASLTSFGPRGRRMRRVDWCVCACVVACVHGSTCEKNMPQQCTGRCL